MRKNNGYIYYDYHKKTEKEEIVEIAWTSLFRWLYAITAILCAVFLALTFFVRIIEVDGDSMKPTLNDADRVVVYTLAYTPTRGDIIIAGSGDDSTRPVTKRVIALAGQTVSIDYAAGTVSVDGETLKEDYLFESMQTKANSEVTYPYTVPKGYVFVMGDNRNVSDDSRNSQIGCVDERYILGKAVLRATPIGDWNIYDTDGENNE